jgi:regulator of sirC expression with transglutaminase-like and TPR domain
MDLDRTLEHLAAHPAASFDLADVALRLAGDEYRSLDVDAYLSELGCMAREARAYVRGNLEARVGGLCRYLFHEMGFRGNVEEYYDPRNSYLNDVLDRRTGIPISLSAIAIAVGRRTGLRVEAVGLPGHFIVKAIGEGEEVLFDPFHGGRLLTLDDCANLVRQTVGDEIGMIPGLLEVAPLGVIVSRMLTNLKLVYLRQQDFLRAARVLGRLRQLNPTDAQHQRDLGLSLLRAGKPGLAIDHLSAYLEEAPESAETREVRNLLSQAITDIARWN